MSFKKQTTASQAKNTSSSNEKISLGEQQPVDNSKVSAVIQEAVISPILSQNQNNLKYYEKNSGKAFEVDFFGNGKKAVSALDVPNLEDVSWSIDRTQAILKIKKPDGKTSFTLHNFQDGTDMTLKDNIDEVSWQTNANRIFYKYYDSKNSARSLNVSDPDGKNWKKIADVPYRNVSIAQIPKTGVVSFWNSPDASVKTIFQTVPIIGGEIKTIYQDSFGADYLWDKSGNRALISHSNDNSGSKIQLGIINYSGDGYKDLNIPTFVSKCIWSEDGKTVFYALPGEIPDGSVLPNDYLDGKFNTTDTFWRVNLETGEKNRLVETNEIKGRYDADSLFLNSSESLLFFTNRIDGKLYRIAL